MRECSFALFIKDESIIGTWGRGEGKKGKGKRKGKTSRRKIPTNRPTSTDQSEPEEASKNSRRRAHAHCLFVWLEILTSLLFSRNAHARLICKQKTSQYFTPNKRATGVRPPAAVFARLRIIPLSLSPT